MEHFIQQGTQLRGFLVELISGFWLLTYKLQKHLNRCFLFWLLAYIIMQQYPIKRQNPKPKGPMKAGY
jgi:low temperature requirement protein LtrA